MDIKVIAMTKQVGDLTISDGHTITDELYILGGRMAGVCYAPDDYFDSKIQNPETAIKRADGCCKSGHHSPFDHGNVTLQITGIPKILAMILNSTQYYTTSEKSARYTIMTALNEKEQELYDKWREIFNKVIAMKYGNKLSEKEIDKLSIENARYMLSVFTPTSLCYTTSYRQYCLLIQWLENYSKFITNHYTVHNMNGHFYKRLQTYIGEFVVKLKSIFNVKIEDNKNGSFQFLGQKPVRGLSEKPYYSDVYITNYKVSFAALAQLQRHRTIHYEMRMDNSYDCFIPPILNDELKRLWVEDFISIKDHYPQCMLVDVVESGRFHDFALKCKERLCSRAQLEIFLQTRETLNKFIENKDNLSYYSYRLLDDITEYWKVVPRCKFSDFRCTDTCTLGPKHCFDRDI